MAKGACVGVAAPRWLIFDRAYRLMGIIVGGRMRAQLDVDGHGKGSVRKPQTRCPSLSLARARGGRGYGRERAVIGPHPRVLVNGRFLGFRPALDGPRWLT